MAQVGKYVIERELARGGMGVVYRAFDPVLRRPCALKVLLGDGAQDPEGLERFLREARALARLRHPGIVDVYDAGTEGGQPYLVMELLEGGSLAALVRDRGPLPARRALELVDRVARAVDAAHAEGILHRDLKPANVLLAADGAPRVTDFGLARDLTGRERAITVGDQMLGTPNYMAPEQAAGENERVGPRSDVYGLGAVLFELLTGRRPYEGATTINVVTKILREPPPSPRALRPDVPVDVDLIVRKAMAKAPEERYDSAAALAADIRRFLEGRPIEARPVGSLERAWKWARRHRARSGLLATALVGAAVVAGLGLEARGLRRRDQARQLEGAALRALDGALREGGGAVERLEAELGRVVDLDPDRAAAWRALARLAVERGDLEAAAARLARADAGERGEADYVRGRLAEAARDHEAAVAAYQAALSAGSREPDLRWRAARAGAAAAAARGHAHAAEEAWWEALRERTDDAAALQALVEGWLRRRDLEALDRGWEEVLRRTRGDGRGWQAVTQSDLEEVADGLRRGSVDAAVAACLLHWRRVYEGLDALAAAGAPLPAEAARSSQLAMDVVGFGGWAKVAAVTTWADGAAPALTLVERAHLLTPADVPALQALVRDGAGALLRAGAALAIAVGATREGGLPAAEARAMLDRLRGDRDPRVSGAADDAAAALRLLEGAAAGPCSAGALALARALLRAQERPAAWLADGADDAWRAACAASLEAAPDPDLLVIRAEHALERGAPAAGLEAARRDVEAALAAAPTHLGARTLAAQLDLVAGRARELDVRADDDPAAHAAARGRVAFSRAYRVVALDAGGGGALRVIAGPDAMDGGFEVLAPLAERGDRGLATLGVTILRSRFRMREVRSFEVVGAEEGGAPTTVNVRVHAPAAGGMGAYYFACATRDGSLLKLKLDGVTQVERSSAKRAANGAKVLLRRARAVFGSGRDVLLDEALTARTSRGHGFVDAEWGWGGRPFFLARVVLVGRWDGAVDAWPALPSERSLRPAPDDLPLVAEHVADGPATLGALRRAGAAFKVDGTWVAGGRAGNVLGVVRLRGDVRLRARVVLRTTAAYAHAGVALRASRAHDAVWLNLVLPRGAPGPLEERRLWLSFQRGAEWEKPIRSAPAELDRGTLLELERRGDYVIARAGLTVEALAPVGGPIYFPFEGEVDACFMGRTTVGSTGQAVFTDVEVLLPP